MYKVHVQTRHEHMARKKRINEKKKRKSSCSRIILCENPEVEMLYTVSQQIHSRIQDKNSTAYDLILDPTTPP